MTVSRPSKPATASLNSSSLFKSSREVLDILDEPEDRGKAIVEEIGKGVCLYKAYEEPANLSEAVKSLVDEVVEKFCKLSLDELLNYVYSLDEVKKTGIGEVIL